MKNKIIYITIIIFLIFSQQSLSDRICSLQSNSLQNLSAIPLHVCRNTRDSPKCQSLYKSIRENGIDPNEKALRCEVDSDLTAFQKIAVSYISCLKGGVVDGIVIPIEEFGKWLGESTAKIIIDLKKTTDRLKWCDQNLDAKAGIYKTYNVSVPQLMQLDVPKNIKEKSCAEIEHEVFILSNQKEQGLARSVDYKHFQTKPSLTQNEAEYLNWKFEKFDILAKDSPGLIEIADAALSDYELHVECYNLETRTALRCEILYHIASGLGIGKTTIDLLSGLKFGSFLKSIKSTQFYLAARTKKKFDNIPNVEKLVAKELATRLKPVDPTFINPNAIHFISKKTEMSVATLDGKLVVTKSINLTNETEIKAYLLLRELGLAKHYHGVTRMNNGSLVMVSDFIEGPLIKCIYRCQINGSLKGIPVGDHTWKEFERIGRVLDENGIVANDLQFILSKETGLPILIDPEQFKFSGEKILSLSLKEAKQSYQLKMKNGKWRDQLDDLDFPPDQEEYRAALSSSKSMTELYSEMIKQSIGTAR